MCLLTKNIILIGHRKSGKTSVGKSLSSFLNLPFVDIDQMVENLYLQDKKIKMKVSEICQKEGLFYFRKLEKKAISSLKDDKNKKIISLGGGSMDSAENQKVLISMGMFYYLKISKDIFINRNAISPPSFFINNNASEKDILSKLENIYIIRSKLFSSLNPVEIDAEKKNINQIAEEIANGIK